MTASTVHAGVSGGHGVSRRAAALDWFFLGVSLTCGIAYLLPRELLNHGGAVGVTIKGLTVSSLAVVAFHRTAPGGRIPLTAALLLSSLGDVFLGLPGERWFVYGLGSFLVAHISYITLFVRNRSKSPGAGIAHRMTAVMLIVFAAGMFAWLWPDLGHMKAPVAAYMGALTGMAVTATLAAFRGWWVPIGAALFVLSDSLIAVGKFKTPVPFSFVVIWATYYAAQVLIALGFIREKASENGSMSAPA